MRLRSRLLVVAVLTCAACGGPAVGGGAPDDAGAPSDAGPSDVGAWDAGASDAGDLDAGELDAGPIDGGELDGGEMDAGEIDAGQVDAGEIDAGPPCTTTITYGANWIHGANHPGNVDVAQGPVTWDGSCAATGSNSEASLSNGWQPYFTGNGGCVIALDYANCPGEPTSCGTRASYGPAWIPPANHAEQYDDVSYRLMWDGRCTNSGSHSKASLSNGWTPNFSANDACEISLRYESCGGLYANPVLSAGCADPGVLLDGDTYYMTCTSGNAANAYPIYTSTDLVNWTAAGHIFPSSAKPSWATGNFWAPEIHKVGNQYVAYFCASYQGGRIAVGAATAPSPLGPFSDIGAPLVRDASVGLIDPTEFEDDQGQPYLAWKVDGNSIGQPTPIMAQPLTADGLALTGSATQLITNDLSWEGNVTEGPWVSSRGGEYFLFYSGNSYANASYAIGVAKASSPLGPYTKFGAPIVSTQDVWVGPGHCSVVPGPSGDLALVYHAWQEGAVNTPGSSRLPLVDTLWWSNGWPEAPVAPTATSQPLP